MADRTLLEMVNSVRYKLRSGDPLSTLPTDEAEIETIVGLINESARDILGGRVWSFDIREDGKASFPPLVEGTTFTSSYGGPVTSLIDPTPATTLEIYFRTAVTTRIQVPGDGDFPNSSFQIKSLLYAAGTPAFYTAILMQNWPGESGTAETKAWKMFSNEHIMPATVGRVLSVRSEETPLRLEFVDKHTEFDRMVPRPHDSFAENESVVYVGGRATSTAQYAGPGSIGEVGEVMTIWPIPNERRFIRYSHTYLHPELESATPTGTFEAVPDNVIHVIEWRAVHMALAGPEKDAAQASAVSQLVREKLSAAIKNDERMPTRRLIPSSFGRVSGRGYRDRWASQLVPSP